MPTTDFLKKPPYWQNLVDLIDDSLFEGYNCMIWTSFCTTGDW